MLLSSTTILASLTSPFYLYFALFIFGIIEGPIPATLTGFLAAHGHINFFIGYIIMVLADTVADSIYYAIGFFGREKLITKWGKYIGIELKEVEHMERLFKNHLGKTVVISKLTHVVGVPFLIAAGLAKTSFIMFTFYNTIGTTIKTLGFVLLGYYSKAAADQINVYLKYGTYFGLGLIALFIIVYYLLTKFMIKRFFSGEK